MSEIEVQGVKYKVVETLPVCQAGMLAKFVETPDGERVAVKCGGVWTWWTAKDRPDCVSCGLRIRIRRI